MTQRDTIRRALEALLNETVLQLTPVGGGSINDTYRAETARGRVFVKHHPNPPAGFFAAEARGLSILAEHSVLGTPRVVAFRDAPRPALLVLDHIASAPPSRGFFAALGRGLAALHQNRSDRFGLDHDNFIGALPQRNTWCTDWLELFSRHRLGAQLALGAQTGVLPLAVCHRLERFIERLGEHVPDGVPASLLHGDLWSGNFLADERGHPLLIDPAVYYGHREVELAFTELFGGFDATFYAAYNEVWPLPADYAERRKVYNLYPLLVHANLFGGSYITRVDGVLRHYVS